VSALGYPRVHFRVIDSTNVRARELATGGAPHGTLVTAASQSAGRGRQGRTWVAPAGRALLCSVLIREPRRLLPLAAGAAVAEVVDSVAQVVDSVAPVVDSAAPGSAAGIKWPNDVLVAGRKVAGILVEGRPQEHWAVVGIGLNVALRPEDFPAELREQAGTLGLDTRAIEPTLQDLLQALERWVGAAEDAVLAAVGARDALLGREVRWAGGRGTGAGIDREGRLLVRTDSGQVALDAGEVHLLGHA
jgi:BirA family transcriptional regulator, biotin operon repressor / biotin---[acetyl-CoA-carboxylase] ligase